MGSSLIDTSGRLSPIMDVRDAASLLAPVRPRLHSPGPWVDLGCGDGTFTAALAEQLPSHSTIEAVDRDADALRRVPPLHAGIVIRTTQCDFDARPLPWSGLAGVLMANALHFVAGQEALLEHLAASLRPSGHLLVVEYDSETPKGEMGAAPCERPLSNAPRLGDRLHSARPSRQAPVVIRGRDVRGVAGTIGNSLGIAPARGRGEGGPEQTGA
ncbi:MAG: class I SAM-dependent methyltransferase [Gemmatimonadetes bacterium]|nr:class I SAM-dependent methyltransferase [Gemmatimonadota bacterium]